MQSRLRRLRMVGEQKKKILWLWALVVIGDSVLTKGRLS
eukprot:COSAG02_NODE_952_length_15692_cov_7.587764_11_plen_39_part_00